MPQPTIFQDTDYLQNEQYKSSANLDARAALHRRFRTAVTPWSVWVFDHLELREDTAVLECGCGPGWLWRENVERIPSDCHITLTDMSAGMVAEAEAALQNSGHNFRFQTTNIQNLPFADDSFDVVIANHMLYHVPDLAAALREVRRVLRADGRFIAATNGQNHLRELWPIGQELWTAENNPIHRLVSAEWTLPFRLENGGEQLTAVFPQVSMFRYDDHLAVTEVDPILDYLFSSSFTGDEARPAPETIAQVRQKLAQQIARDGAIHITKDTGLFVCPGG
ncbi:MAG TPA: class I SAM-dependent methyltransferase [Chloroflexota bacterium]|nr:class I SAM-dependent methyltransferase [Chloroflexota bacterium]HUM71467.1 class I SAM-dependent methyltransferase [Chloroflexota bacterium]